MPTRASSAPTFIFTPIQEKGNYYLYVNGEQVARWEEVKEMDTIFENESGDDEGEDGESAGKYEFKPGNTLALGGYDSLNMAVFHLNVFDWNGAIPHLEEELDIISRYDPTAPRDKALLVNGDVLRGAISLQEEGSIRIKSDHYDVTVPTARVRALDQKGHEEKDLPEDSSDTRVFLDGPEQSFPCPGNYPERGHGRALIRSRQGPDSAPIRQKGPVQPAKPGAEEAEGNAVPVQIKASPPGRPFRRKPAAGKARRSIRYRSSISSARRTALFTA